MSARICRTVRVKISRYMLANTTLSDGDHERKSTQYIALKPAYWSYPGVVVMYAKPEAGDSSSTGVSLLIFGVFGVFRVFVLWQLRWVVWRFLSYLPATGQSRACESMEYARYLDGTSHLSSKWKMVQGTREIGTCQPFLRGIRRVCPWQHPDS